MQVRIHAWWTEIAQMQPISCLKILHANEISQMSCGELYRFEEINEMDITAIHDFPCRKDGSQPVIVQMSSDYAF